MKSSYRCAGPAGPVRGRLWRGSAVLAALLVTGAGGPGIAGSAVVGFVDTLYSC